ncbi:hypothetical protein STVIR_5560 [Streptomyces viridochromogenes Tue57]|uniref:N-acetyltransferase domain-containing protein n=1 Tax=Streptomyces viridochromogenes Tue57 TaxID=1160705 RepID=L8PDQ8_STRVR|nr:hypothetical protein STVIR_5560 [Streptomyces viridochromogenes Tue57]
MGTVQATVTEDRTAEIAWVVGTPRQGRGFASEAARGLVARLERQAVRTVVAHIHPDHPASAAVTAAAGLTRPTRSRTARPGGGCRYGPDMTARHARRQVPPPPEAFAKLVPRHLGAGPP